MSHWDLQAKIPDHGLFAFATTNPPAENALAVTLYLMGVSMNAIARLLNISTPAVLLWLKKFPIDTYEKPEPAHAVVIEPVEMLHF